MVAAQFLGVAELQATHHVAACGIADPCHAVAVALSLHDVAGDILLVLDAYVGVAAEGREVEVLDDGPGGLAVHVNVSHTVVVIDAELTEGIEDLGGCIVLVPDAVGIALGGIGGVVLACSIEEVVRAVHHLAVALGSGDAEFELEVTVEGILLGVELGSIVGHLGILDDTFLLHHTNRSAHVVFVCARRPGQAVVLGDGGTVLDGLKPVGIGTEIGEACATAGSMFAPVGCTHQVEVLIDVVDAELSVVVETRHARFALHGGHHDDASSATAAVLCGLRCVLQDGHALDVVRGQGIEHRHVAKDAIDDYQWIAAARKRAGAADVDAGVAHGVAARLCDHYTG